MASLKEIRGRISSVTTTRKITDVTQMIASAKLHKTQGMLVRFRLYFEKIENIFFDFLRSGDLSDTPFSEKRKVERVAIISFSSNGSLCGAFNLNAIKKTEEILDSYSHLEPDSITLYALGRKIYDNFSSRKGIKVVGPFFDLVDGASYEGISPLADELMKMFLNREVDKIEVVYNRFKNILTQIPTHEEFLPLVVPPKDMQSKQTLVDYIVEPGRNELILGLAPQLIRLNLYGRLLESASSEYAARSSAMQTATENANELIEDLSKEYNRLRQAAITNEILDIIGGAEVLR